MNELRLAVGWGQFAAALLLGFLTLRSYRNLTIPSSRRNLLICGWAALAGIAFLQKGLLQSLRPGVLYFLTNTCGDELLLGLAVFLLVRTAALVRQHRQENAR